ncbi:lysozyme [Kitasatospora sp. NBC_00240]|uniref:lysozyme n=1 Tax=Kitasatospora sp. NBC_00240 TaxID=2903567 RepID=UPI002254A1A6|nr:lysozyme [Kitasatospora sp. NBC_00240]MCX5214797.1 lysozyme [Kitasatospora sp. NBC_00240]
MPRTSRAARAVAARPPGTRPARSRRLPRVAAAALAAGALLGGATAPAQAQPSRPLPIILHPDLDHAGSTVAAHEGRSNSPVARPRAVQTQGMDVSSYQGDVNWNAAVSNGAQFAYLKATEGTTYLNPYFYAQSGGSFLAGVVRGAYHFALPNLSGAAAQANFFVDHGGGWTPDGLTLPPALDIEYNPYGADCYGLSQSAMVDWIREFSDTVHDRTSRYPLIYTTTAWWSSCTGNNAGFGATNPLWVARYASSVGTLPAGWGFQTIWQYADSGSLPGDQDWFNGPYDRVQALANG